MHHPAYKKSNMSDLQWGETGLEQAVYQYTKYNICKLVTKYTFNKTRMLTK